MLLRHTSSQVKDRSALTVNPAKTCQPIGAMYAALGIHRCLPHSHGSQGCCSYHRSTLTRHYKEPVMAATSSFTEGSAVFGGQSNLLQAIETIFKVYNPDIIAVHTTCLSETIGDDIPQIADKARSEGKVPPGKFIIHCNTPSYVGSHITGFSAMTKAMVDYFAESSGQKKQQLNLVPGWVEPADMRELKRLVTLMGLTPVCFPDTSDVLDIAQTGQHEMYPRGGVTVEQLRSTGDSLATIALGPTASTAAADALDAQCHIPSETLELPLGLHATDRFLMAIRKLTGAPIPEALTVQRGRLLDMMLDMHQYTYNRTVALFGDPDQLVALSEFLISLDMKPVYIVTGTPGKKFEARMADVLAQAAAPYEATVRQGPGADIYYLHQLIKNAKPDLLIGNTYGKYIARDDDLPFLRFGFPILDRVGHQYFPTVGYIGAMRLLEQILAVLMDRQDRDTPEESFELQM